MNEIDKENNPFFPKKKEKDIESFFKENQIIIEKRNDDKWNDFNMANYNYYKHLDKLSIITPQSNNLITGTSIPNSNISNNYYIGIDPVGYNVPIIEGYNLQNEKQQHLDLEKEFFNGNT